MSEKKPGNPGQTAGSARRVLSFFLFLGRRAGKTRAFFFLTLVPIILAVVLRGSYTERPADVTSVFLEILMVFYLQFLVIILTLFYGTSVSAEEVEGKTLAYLTTRPLAKAGIILGKYAAYVILIVGMVLVSLTASYLIINVRALSTTAILNFLRYAGVLVLAILCYTAFFTFLGTILKRAILVGLAFGFGWEAVIQYFPGSTQRISIIHYLKSLLPQYSSVGKFSILLFRLEPTRPWLSILALVLLTAVFLGLACLVFSYKEYISED